MSRKIIAWGPAVAWAAVLFAASAVPGGAGRAFLDLPDKVLHFAVYSVLGAALAHGRYRGAPRVPHVAMMAMGAIYAATDEWHQAFVPRREPSLGDWVADLAGVCVGYTIAWLLATALLRRRAASEKGTTT